MTLFATIMFFIFGSMIGSFLNVLIHRLPKEEDFVKKGSYCPQCNTSIKWYFNIPLFGYLILRGKCKACGVKISLRYPLVELATGLISLALMPSSLHLNALIEYSFTFSVACVFLVHFFIDIKHQILPDGLNLYLGLIFAAYTFAYGDWKNGAMGGAIGFLFPLGITYAFYLIKGQVGLGGGDIKLWGALGLYLGAKGIVFNIFASCFFGSIISVLLLATKRIKKDQPVPFGPFIILAAVLQIYFPGTLEKILPFWNFGS